MIGKITAEEEPKEEAAMDGKCLGSEQGAALVLSLLTMLVLSLLGVAAIYTSSVEVMISKNEGDSLESFYKAQAAMKDAEIRLMLNTADTRGAAGYSRDDADWRVDVNNVALPGSGSYSYTLTHVRELNAGNYVVKKDAGNSPYYRITALGINGESQFQAEEIVTLTFSNLWTRAVTSCGSLKVNSNSATDSYDSGVGPYGGGNVGNQGDIYVSGDVDFDSNTEFAGSVTATGDVNINGNSDVHGDATSGGSINLESNNNDLNGNATAGGNISNSGDINGNATAGGAVNNSGNITGTTTSGASVPPVDPPPECDFDNRIPIPPSIDSTNDNGDMICAPVGDCSAGCFLSNALCELGGSAVITLPGGTADNPKKYYFNGLEVNSNVQVVTTGHVEIYVEGDLTMNSNSIMAGSEFSGDPNNPGNPKPAEILVYSFGESNANPGTAANVDLASNVQLFGKLYAPDASSTIINSNSKVYGAMIAGGLCQNCGNDGGGLDSNGSVSYDEALAAVTNPIADEVTREEWRDCNFGTYASAFQVYAAGSCRPQ